MGKIKKKISKEYEIFFMDMTRTSKANIFANSKEIELKKSIYGILQEEKFTKEQEEILWACENLLEELYRYVDDNLSKDEQNVHGLVMKWVREKG